MKKTTMTLSNDIDAEVLDQKASSKNDSSDDLTADSGSSSEDDSNELVG